MSIRLSTPTTRLICFGSARALTNDQPEGEIFEDDLQGKFVG